MKNKIDKLQARVILVALISLLVFWSPFFLHLKKFWGIEFGQQASMKTIVQNFDGLNFLAIVKSHFYQPDELNQFGAIIERPPIYFTAHYPGYALVIGIFDLWLDGPQAVLASIILGNILLSIGLYQFFKLIFKDKNKAFYLSLISLFLPARMLVIRGVGSTETYFIFFSLMSLIAAIKQKHWLAGFWGGLGVITRSPGILLFGGYVLFYLRKYKTNLSLFIKTIIPYLLIPLSLIGVWLFYGWRFGSFWAYFHSGDNLHLYWPPFQVFGSNQKWVSGMWLEDIIYIYLIFSLGLYLFWQKVKGTTLEIAFYWASIYFGVILLVVHRDIARYSLPIAPVVIAGYGFHLKKSKYEWWWLWLVIPIMLWSWQFGLHNIQPIANWKPFI